MRWVQFIVSLLLLALLIFINQRFGSEQSAVYGGLTWFGWLSILAFGTGVGLLILAGDLFSKIGFFRWQTKTPTAAEKPRQLTAAELTELGIEKYRGPAYPHPVIFSERCIGCQACVDACPHDVLAIVDGRAAVVAADQCMEDTACEAECPVNPKACIVINTTKQVRSRPAPARDGATYQTNVPGCYIIGDVSGVPLIKNAVKEGAEVVARIAEDLKTTPATPKADYDVAIIGAGPGGASAAATAHEAGLRYIAVEQDKILSTIQLYPKGKYIFFKPDTKDWFGGLKAVGLGLVKAKYQTEEVRQEISLGKETETLIPAQAAQIKTELSKNIPSSLHTEYLPLLDEKIALELRQQIAAFVLENGETAFAKDAKDREENLAHIRRIVADQLETKIPGDQRERILAVWLSSLTEKGVKINEEESCKSVTRAEDGDYFTIKTERGSAKTPQTYTARRVVLAIGLRGAPNKLRLPNEDLKISIDGREVNKVFYALSNPADFKGKNLIVVGGGNSAVEAAVDLVVTRDGANITPRPPEEMNRVTLLVRDYLAPTVKFGNKYHLYQMADRGILNLRFGAAIKEMRENEVTLMDTVTKAEIGTIPNDHIFALIGGERPDRFLQSIGIEIS